MKRISFLLATVVLAVGTIALSSFTVKDFDSKAFANVCFIKHQNTTYTSAVGAISPAPCDDGSIYCGFCYNDSQTNFTLDQAKALADENQSEEDGTVVTSPTGKQVTIHRRSTTQPE